MFNFDPFKRSAKRESDKRMETIDAPLPELLREGIGQTIICDDGVARKVVDLVGSFARPDSIIINESDPDSENGHFCHMLLFASQMMGQSLPTEEEKAAASRLWRKMTNAKAESTLDHLASGKTRLELDD